MTKAALNTNFGTIAAYRFGYGPRAGEARAGNVDDLIAQVSLGIREVCPFPYDGIAGRCASFAQFRVLFRQYKEAQKSGTVRKMGGRNVNPHQIGLTTAFQRDQHLKVQHSARSPHGFFERLAAFWCDHFAISAGKNASMRILVGLYEAEALRPRLAGRFEQLLQAAVLHPAMLSYLDQPRSIGPNSPAGRKRGSGLNENLARELIELHTMGAGSGYTQQDVRAAACVLTGLDHRSGAFETVYRPEWSEPGVHRVLGRAYGGSAHGMEDVTDLLSDLAAMEATRRHICRKLVVHFIADEPPAEIVEAMVAAWAATGGNLMDVYRAMLEHPRSWEEEGQKARQPFDFVVAGLRALDVPAEALGPLPPAGSPAAGAAAASGMAPPSPAVADGADAMRNELADPPVIDVGEIAGVAEPTADGRVPLRPNPLTVGALQRLGQPMWRPPSPAGWDESMAGWITASQLTERIAWAGRLAARFGGDSDPRQVLETVLADAARDDTIKVVSRAPSRQAGLVLMLASPEFNRR